MPAGTSVWMLRALMRKPGLPLRVTRMESVRVDCRKRQRQGLSESGQRRVPGYPNQKPRDTAPNGKLEYCVFCQKEGEGEDTGRMTKVINVFLGEQILIEKNFS